jgi:hypothetical protein
MLYHSPSRPSLKINKSKVGSGNTRREYRHLAFLPFRSRLQETGEAWWSQSFDQQQDGNRASHGPGPTDEQPTQPAGTGLRANCSLMGAVPGDPSRCNVCACDEVYNREYQCSTGYGQPAISLCGDVTVKRVFAFYSVHTEAISTEDFPRASLFTGSNIKFDYYGPRK